MSDRLDAYIPLLKLLRVKGLAGQRLRRLVTTFGSPEQVLAAPVSALSQVQGISLEIAEGIRDAAKGVFDREIGSDIHWLRKHQGRIVSCFESEYPAILNEIHSPPVLLYYQGNLLNSETSIAIVGSRQASDYGRRLAGRLAEELASAGFTIVSGLAHGIDGAAHMGALRAGGRSIAVMGTGLKMIYPRHHRDLAQQIILSGALISELPLDTTPQRKNFIPRNRIIAGLCLGTIVVEAAERSGALSTAHFAQEENREVFAIPGRAGDEMSRGTNRLIRENGAQLVTSADEVLAVLKERMDLRTTIGETTSKASINLAQTTVSPKLDDDERRIYDTLSIEPRHIDDIVRETGLMVGKVSSLLGLLELRGVVERVAGAQFRRMEGMG